MDLKIFFSASEFEIEFVVPYPVANPARNIVFAFSLRCRGKA